MSENCNHNCSECSLDCASRDPESFLEKPHELSHIKKVIGVISGKGGVGKSMVTALTAAAVQKSSYKSAVLDADITGPSIPRIFGIKGKASGSEDGIYPLYSKNGTAVMSVNLLLENDSDPVVWRGPIIAGVVKQFWTDVIWDDVDFMFVDMPPGTGDVPLTVFQSLPLDGVIVVSSPQELVSMIVEKAVNMASMMNIPVIGIVENMSYFKCPVCGLNLKPFGESHIDELAEKHGIDTVCKMPIDPELASAADKGSIESCELRCLDPIVEKLKAML